MFPSEVSKWAVAERDDRTDIVADCVVTGIIGDDRVETKPVKVTDQRFEGGTAVDMQRCTASAFVVPHGLSIAGAAVESLRHRQHHSSEHRDRWRLEAECWGVGSQRVAVLRPANVASAPDLDVNESDITHPFKMRPNRVRVKRKRVGDLGGDQRSGCSCQLEVDRVARVVAQRLQHIELG